MYLVILISIIASIIAGVGTGLVGLSAATAITPLLIKFGIPVHQAIYVALMSDVVASAFTSREYALNGHLVNNCGDGKSNLPVTWLIFGFTIFFTIIGAVVSSNISEEGVGSAAYVISFFVGIKFIIEFLIQKPNDNPKSTNKLIKKLQNCPNSVTFVATIIGGAVIGLTSGFAGVGGGMTMLIVFGAFGYKLKDAVCVSTLTMIVVALIGGILHYQLNVGIEYDDKINRWVLLSLCVVVTTISAWITSRLANRCVDKYHKLLCGILLLTALVITKIL